MGHTSHQSMKRIFTDVYMYDPDLSAEIHAFAAHLDGERERRTIAFPTNDYDLVLDIVKTEGDKTIWAYYYVDYQTTTLFWLHHYECGDGLLREIRGVSEGSHVSAYYSVHLLRPYKST